MTALRTFDEALTAVRDVDGWMSPDQAERLYRAALSTRPGDQIVEIGSFRGRSTIVLASAANAEATVVAIDPHAGNDRGPQEIEGFAAEAATDHDIFNRNLAQAGVTRVAPGGTMLIHDSFSSVGVTLAILRELVWGGRFRYVGRARSLTEFRADLDTSVGSRVLNAATLLLQLPWFVKNLTIKVLLTLKLGVVVAKVTGREPEWPY